jgi:hypothetical protein
MNFERGIGDKLVAALERSPLWKEIASDPDLFFALRGKTLTVYYQGSVICRVSLEQGRLQFKTHYKYLLKPGIKDLYIPWNEQSRSIADQVEMIFIDTVDLGALKATASASSTMESKGVHSVLKSNRNVIDVEIPLTREASAKQSRDGQKGKKSQFSDQIDFAVLQRASGAARVKFFQAKRFDNADLQSPTGAFGGRVSAQPDKYRKIIGETPRDAEAAYRRFFALKRADVPEIRPAPGGAPPIVVHIEKCRKLIGENQKEMQAAYRRLCENLVRLTPDRCDPLVAEVAAGTADLTIDSEVRLVTFGFDSDPRDARLWLGQAEGLRALLGDHRFLTRGDPVGFTRGISS